jgi:hypothetical protein
MMVRKKALHTEIMKTGTQFYLTVINEEKER